MKLLSLGLLLVVLLSGSALAQPVSPPVEPPLPRVSSVEHQVRNYGSQGPILFLFGAFCALWAQNSGRSGWLWFFLGLVFSFLAVLVLLWKNSADLDRRAQTVRRT